ncbi:MAG TPA: ZIP family metal transporter [Lacipirellulaceae bacterium]|jgi:zinc and cadmium transporter|nr:ZIP family metal transporter [Lacipirellulaceae bacterium]
MQQHTASSIQTTPMPDMVLIAYYCALVLVASIIGGMIPVWFQLTHRWMQFAVSFVAGVMLGVAVLHMLPHAIAEAVSLADQSSTAAQSGTFNPDPATRQAVVGTMVALLAGMLAMFFIERFFSYHHHDVPEQTEPQHPSQHGGRHTHDHHSHNGTHSHDLSWSGAALGLALHSVLNGVALAAAVGHRGDSWLAGLGTFLVIFLHKPFDAMTIGMLMARSRRSLAWRQSVNTLFALAVPLGAILFYFGLMTDGHSPTGSQQLWVAYALAFSAGTFLCISLSDLLPELQFHHHDRVKLSVALMLGLAVAYAASRLEEATAHVHPTVAGALSVP